MNILLLLQQGLLQEPILYLSRYIILEKADYYRLLREVTENGDWETWVLFMLRAAQVTSTATLRQIESIRNLMEDYGAQMRQAVPAVYSRELLEVLFRLPYCKTKFVVDAEIAKRQTASKYLQALSEAKLLDSVKIGREMVYVNRQYLELLSKPFVDDVDTSI